MKKFRLITVLALILSAGLVGWLFKASCTTLPVGWTIVTNGTKYKFKRANDGLAVNSQYTERGVIVYACEQKIYEDKYNNRGQWTEVAN